jgi:CMP-N,N'-diacetyllegionaminic acid synthase
MDHPKILTTAAKPKVLCVIGARAGSTGITNKNILPICGKPLIAWSIEQALQSKYIDRVVVSTDSKDIAEVACSYGADVPFIRPAELATSVAGKFSVFKHALSECTQIYETKYDTYLDLDCTNPLRDPIDIDSALNLLWEDRNVNADGVFTICEARKNPYFNLVEPAADGFLDFSKRCNPPIVRRQDAPPVFEHVASIYALRPIFIQTSTNLFEGKLVGYDIGQEKSLDIDSPFDFELVEFLLSKKQIVNR